MSANAMKPTFTDKEGYLQWKAQWKAVYTTLAAEIREAKAEAANASRNKDPRAPKLQRELRFRQAMAFKMMSVLEEGKQRRDRILEMHRQLAEQNAQFPLSLGKCRTIDFHFNKGSLEFPFLPMWTLKAQGKTFYIHHLDANVPFSTRELPEGSTRGMIRFRNCDLTIDAEGTAHITETVRAELKEAA